MGLEHSSLAGCAHAAVANREKAKERKVNLMVYRFGKKRQKSGIAQIKVKTQKWGGLLDGESVKVSLKCGLANYSFSRTSLTVSRLT